LIEKAEAYESAADQLMPGMHQDDERWHPRRASSEQALRLHRLC